MAQYPLEFAKNRLLVTGFPSHMYLVEDWCVVKCIADPKATNIKTYALPMPGFDEKSFPFIVVCGECHISILDITTLEHKPLTNGMTPSGIGVRFAFATGDLS